MRAAAFALATSSRRTADMKREDALEYHARGRPGKIAGLQQFLRSQEAANDICAGGNGGLHRGQSSTHPSRSLNLRELYRSSMDEEDDLATYVPGPPFFKRLGRCLERVGAI